MSLFVQGYAFRIASLAIGTWFLDGLVLDADPSTTAIGLGRSRPNAVRLDAASSLPARGDPLASLHQTLVEGHLAPFVDNAHEAVRIGRPLLWSNIGAACASSFGAFMGPLADRRTDIRDRFQHFLAAARPELRASGRIRIVEVGPLWAWERAACCLWHLTDSGFKCEDCSLWTEDERKQSYKRVMAELSE